MKVDTVVEYDVLAGDSRAVITAILCRLGGMTVSVGGWFLSCGQGSVLQQDRR